MERIVTLREFMRRHHKELPMPDMPNDRIPAEVLKKVAGTSKCADDDPQDDCCEEDDD